MARGHCQPGVLAVGLVGCGRFARFLLSAAALVPGLRLVALASRSQENLDATAALWRRLRPGDPVPRRFARWERLVASPLDAVIVATPPHLHAEVGEAALAAGKHVFLEKPGALHAHGLRSLQALADARGLQAAVNMVMRQNPLWQLVRRSLELGWRGSLETMEVTNEAHGDLPPDHWFWDVERSGGILVEHGIHFLDLFGWLAGPGRPLCAWQAPSLSQRASPRVLAVVEHPGDGSAPVVAAHGHGFVHAPGLGRCQVRLTWRDGFLAADGWTAFRARLDGFPPVEVARLWQEAGARAAEGEDGRPGQRLLLILGAEEDVYRECVRANLAGFQAAIAGKAYPSPQDLPPQRPPSPGEVAPSLELAGRLTEMAASRT